MLRYSKNCILIVLTLCSCFKSLGQEKIITEQGLFVDSVWSGHPVDFDLLTTKKYQYVAYYNSNRQMTVAQRELNSKYWKKKQLPSITGWDSHNYVTIEIDNDGFLHISGNMQGDTLVYFRSVYPENIDKLAQLSMTGKLKTEVTYPV